MAPFTRQWQTIVVCTLIALVLAIIYLVVASPVYRAEAKVAVRSGTPMGLQTADQRNRFFKNQCEQIRGLSVLSLALSGSDIGDSSTLRTMSSSRRLEYLGEQLSVQPEKDSDFITIAMTSPSARDSADIANAVLSAYEKTQSTLSDTFISQKIAPRESEKETSAKQIVDKQKEIESLQKQLNDPGNVNGNLTMAQMTALSEELPKARARTLESQSLYEQASKMLGEDAQTQKYLEEASRAGAGLAVSDEDLATYREKMIADQQKLRDGLRSYLSSHPILVGLQDQYNRSLARYIVASKARWTLAQMREDAYTKSLEEARRITREISDRTNRLGDLTRQVADLQKKRSMLDSQISEEKSGFSFTSAAVISHDLAQAPATPISPRKVRVILTGLLLGFLAGLVFAKMRDNAQAGMRSASEIRAFLGLPVMGAVPSIKQLETQEERAIAAIEPEGNVAEAFRGIRAALYKGLAKDRAKTLVVVSPEAGEGKSLVVANLAVSLVEQNLKVLVIDLNLRNPMLHRVFHARNELGVSGVLSGDERIEDVIQQTEIHNLDILPAGEVRRNPADLINQPAYVELLDQLSQSYDRIIIDSPSVLSAADARIASAGTDLALLVVRCGKSHRKLTDLAKDGLLNVGANLLGVVVNDVPAAKMDEFGGLGYVPYGSAKNSPNEKELDSPSAQQMLILPRSVGNES